MPHPAKPSARSRTAPVDPLELLLSPRETLRVLDYIARNPTGHGDTAVRDLRISHHSWYAAIKRLEGLHLIVRDRYPGGRKVRNIVLTPAGRQALPLLEGLRELTKDSSAVLEAELESHPPLHRSPEAGEMVLRLAEFAERRGDFAAIERAAQHARELGRTGEADFARGLALFTKGERKAAAVPFGQALKSLEGEIGARSYRRALFYHGVVQSDRGDDRSGYLELTRLRKLAQEAGDHASEADARLGIGVLKFTRGQYKDAAVQFEKALVSARKAGLPSKVAKVLTNLCMAEFCLDPRKGLARSEEALIAAREVGAQLLLVHIHNNRSLIFAVQGRKKEALAEMAEGRRLARETGYERGREARDGWERLVRRILRRRPKAYQLDWRGQVLDLLRTSTSRLPEEPPEPSEGRGPSE